MSALFDFGASRKLVAMTDNREAEVVGWIEVPDLRVITLMGAS